ncbi:unnamed protein product [Trichobilharzia regenti]|nr:unnamed protein product [Trichobilharzia regenti]
MHLKYEHNLVCKLDAWEQAGNQPGFRVQVLTALQQTVRQMLELIRTKGFGAVKLDTDYVFFPPASDLHTSSGSIPRNRPRTWHQLPGHNSLVISSQNKSDYGINENLYERENDIYITRESFDSTPISTNQFTQNNTCWCTAQPMRCPTHHSLGYSSSLSSSPIRLNPNVHSVVNQMHLSPYSTVDERYLFKGNNKS